MKRLTQPLPRRGAYLAGLSSVAALGNLKIPISSTAAVYSGARLNLLRSPRGLFGTLGPIASIRAGYDLEGDLVKILSLLRGAMLSLQASILPRFSQVIEMSLTEF